MKAVRVGPLALLVATGAAFGRARVVELPTEKFVADAEAANYDLPHASTLPGGRSVVEFGSIGEVRNLACAWVDAHKQKASCSYEYRIDFFGVKSDWVMTTNKFARDRKGQFLNSCRPSDARIESRR